jgi:hypothetical protein
VGYRDHLTLMGSLQRKKMGNLVLTEADHDGEDDKSIGHGNERRHKGVDDELQRLRTAKLKVHSM